MSPGEIWWRCGRKLRDTSDRMLLPLRSRTPAPDDMLVVPPGGSVLASNALGVHLSDENFGYPPDLAVAWRQRLVAEADRIVQGRLTLFDLEDCDLGGAIDWNYEYKARKRSPMTPSSQVDYRDHAVTGDCKFVWEPNRHCHLVVLARAYRITKDERYATAALGQLESWIRACPFGIGMNWRSPLELAIRLINWVFTLELLRESAALSADRLKHLLPVVYQHLWEITRKYSRFSSANNHLIGEAAGVFIAASYFEGLKKSAGWRNEARDILTREIIAQTYADGGTREQATGYHLFSLEFFVLAGLTARNVGTDFSTAYWDRLEKMFGFVAGLTEASNSLPMIGDADDGYVLDLGGRNEPQSGSCPRVASFMTIGAVLFGRSDYKALTGGFREPAFWLFGKDGRERFDNLSVPEQPWPLESRAMTESGYYLIQRGGRADPDRISLLFDCGDLGFLSIAAHGHADALSVILRIGGVDVLVDPGTYDYFTHPRWRNYFRSTRAHNTVTIDDTDQSEMLGPFLWGRRARCRLIRWLPTSRGGTVDAEHDGYTRLEDPVVHRRSVTLLDDEDVLVVRDEILAKGRHTVTLCWHFSEHCRVEQTASNQFRVEFEGGQVAMAMEPTLSVTTSFASEDPICGWVSRGYHRRTPSTTVIGRTTSDGDVVLTTRLNLAAGKRPRSRQTVAAAHGESR